jgi:hypothetical protein
MDRNTFEVISTYTAQQAVEDGLFVELFKNRWQQLSAGKPILATEHLFHSVSLSALQEIWNEYVAWRKDKTNPDRIFTTAMNSRKVWLVEDAAVFTMMYPEDY